jgi:hypothetical protein
MVLNMTSPVEPSQVSGVTSHSTSTRAAKRKQPRRSRPSDTGVDQLKIKSFEHLDETVTAQYVDRQVKVAVGRTPRSHGKQDVEAAVRTQLRGKAARMRASHSASSIQVTNDVYVP